MKQAFLTLLDQLPEITLDEMSAIRLMNRTDQKYLATEAQLSELLSMVRNDYLVQVVDGKHASFYHTVYLDDSENSMYLAHHNGKLTRQKVRMRTYLDTGSTYFEMKQKNNHGRTRKKRLPVVSSDFLHQAGVVKLFDKYSVLKVPLSDITPKVENLFERVTLVNKARTERITIDTSLSFHNLSNDCRSEMGDLVVIEVKRDGYTYSPIVGMLRELRIHPSGFSKYCIGSAVTNPELKRNRFLTRIRMINKMINN